MAQKKKAPSARSKGKPSTHPAAKTSTALPKEVSVGAAGELHQTASAHVQTLTTQQGIPVADDQNTLRLGPRGPALLEDFHFREKIFHFDHERIPERVVHARGYGAHGFFELTESLSDVTRADIFQRVGEKTEEGNWDLVGNNIPVFFIQDAIKFPDIIHAVKPEPDRAFPQAQSAHDNFWDFISLTPESMHMIMWVMSDRAIPRSFRFMEGFGVHTFRLLDGEDQSTFVKFHWKPKLGLQSVAWNEAVKINGADPDFHRRDLWDAIQSGNYPEWELGVQLFDQEFADNFEFDVLDPTKIIPEEVLPVRVVGRLVLDRMPDNFFAETEQVAFCTQNIPPGIDFSNDPLLQGRNFSYLDTQIKRLGGPNFTHIPVNAPRCPFAHFQQDGHMAMRNPKGRVNYEPNSWGDQGGPRENPDKGFRSFADPGNEGPKVRLRPESFADHYSQARLFYVSQTATEQKHLVEALVFELSKVERPDIRIRMVSHLVNIHEHLAGNVARGLGMEVPEPTPAARPTLKDLDPSDALSILKRNIGSFEGRKLGILATDHADAELFSALTEAVEAAGGVFEVIAPKISGVTLSDETAVLANQKIDGGPSVLYDAVALLISGEGAVSLGKDAPTKDFISDAFAHCKFIAYTAEAEPLLQKAGVEIDEGFVQLEEPENAETFIELCGELRFWDREVLVDADA